MALSDFCVKPFQLGAINDRDSFEVGLNIGLKYLGLAPF